MVRPCDLCESTRARLVLQGDRLDGPLVQCSHCGLIYVGERRRDFTFASADHDKSSKLAARVHALELVDESVEAAEAPWRERVCEERLQELRRYVTEGRLLEVGCASGEFLRAAARAGFRVEGVEPEPSTGAIAREAHGLSVITGTLTDARYSSDSFDVATLFHVLEHLDSPRQTVIELHRILKPGGVLAIETPNIDTIWFRLLRKRWRQFIPDHYFFFTPPTLRRLLEEAGFCVLEIKKVGKPMSVRLFVDRIRRFNVVLGKAANRLIRMLRLEARTLRLNLGDVMLVVARKES